jgi:hypothetical protein
MVTLIPRSNEVMFHSPTSGFERMKKISLPRRLTSGVPLGRRNSSGTICFIFFFLSSSYGVGLALYSVRAKLVSDDVLARGSSLRDGCTTGCWEGDLSFVPLMAMASSVVVGIINLMFLDNGMPRFLPVPALVCVVEWMDQLTLISVFGS